MSSRPSVTGGSASTEEPQTSDLAAALTNPPGLASIAYRLGTYDTFFQAMLALIPTQTVPDLSGSGQILRPLAALTTRDPSDLTIALLDAWAIVCDVVTFYQERNANEGYLRTALDRRSVLELARAIGYEFDPGLGASVDLVFTVANGAIGPVTVPKGTQVQSIPAQGRQPQIFETGETVEARIEWNTLKPQLTVPQQVQSGGSQLDLAGTSTQLQPGQPILFSADPPCVDVGILQSVTPNAPGGTTHITWQPPLTCDYTHLSAVTAFRRTTNLFGYNAPAWRDVPPAVRASYGDTLPSAITSVATSPDGARAVTGQEDGSLILWNVNTQTVSISQSTRIERAHDSVLSVAFSPDGKSILSGGADGLVKLWDAAGNLPVTLARHTGAVNSVAFSPNYGSDGQILSGSADHTVILWTNGQPTVLQGHTGAVNSVAFSGSYGSADHRLISGSADGTVILWTNGQVTHAFTGHSGAVTCVAFSRDGGSILSGGVDTVIILRDVTNTNYPSVVFTGHTAAVNSVAFSPNFSSDHQFLSGGSDSRVMVWNTLSPPAHTALLRHILSVNGVSYLLPGNGGTALSASSDTTLVLWNLQTGQAIAQGTQKTMDEWPHFTLKPNQIDLATVDPTIVPGSTVLLRTSDGSAEAVFTVRNVEVASRSDYLLTGQVTRITPDRNVNPRTFDLRDTIVATHDEALSLAVAPVTAPVPPCSSATSGLPGDSASSVQLGSAVAGLRKGQRLALSGEIYDCKAGRGIGTTATEILTLQGVSRDGMNGPTVLDFDAPLSNHYVRDTVSLNANVAPATQGQTVPLEVLGSGDGTRANQQFTLKRTPLTYVSAPTVTGARSTLLVSVSHVEWQEAPSFYGLGPHSRAYVVRTDAAGQATVLFGDGKQGARLPTGQENVTATYRIGIGLAGEVEAGTLTQPTNKPSGIASVTNPLKATGAAEPDTRDSARVRAPVTVRTLGRVVSLQDYDDFVHTFAGVGRARTSLLWNGRTRVVHITILGADGQDIPSDSALYTSLVDGLQAVRDPSLPVAIQSGTKLIVLFAVAARVWLQPDYEAAPVQAAITAAISSTFALSRRQFGQGVAASEILSVMQGIRGVRGIDLISFYKKESPPALHTYLDVALAHWDGATFCPDQLLVVDKESGIDLIMETAS